MLATEMVKLDIEDGSIYFSGLYLFRALFGDDGQSALHYVLLYQLVLVIILDIYIRRKGLRERQDCWLHERHG